MRKKQFIKVIWDVSNEEFYLHTYVVHTSP